VEGVVLGQAPKQLAAYTWYAALLVLAQAFVRTLVRGAVTSPVPDMKVTTETGSLFGDVLTFAAGGMRGWRDAMEDAHVAELLDPTVFPECAVFAVLDGHGGSEVSKLASKLLSREVNACGRGQLQAAEHGKNGRGQGPDLQQALEEALPRLDLLLRRGPCGLGSLFPNMMHPFSTMGCTACVVGLDQARHEVVCANVGDSRAFLIKKGKAIALSEDHKPENPEERNRIRAAGGQVVKAGPCHRVDGNLNLSRALGDFYLKANRELPPEKQKVIAVPDTKRDTFSGGPQELLVLACDGLFEKRSNQDVADLVWPRLKSGMTLEQAGRETLEKCCARGNRGRPMEEGTDNETIVLIRLASGVPADGEASGATFAAGQRVRIHGLESEAGRALNGQEGVVEGPAPGGGDRLGVLLSDGSGEVKALRATNLKPF